MPEFRKRDPGAPAHFFAWEAAGLRWLASCKDGPAVVSVLDVDETSIALERLTPRPPSPADAEQFGRQLAHLHAAGAAAFGAGPPEWTGDGFIGAAPLPLRAHRRWGTFYADERLLPYVRLARDAGTLTSGDAGLLERVCSRLHAGEWDDDRPPARLHGDLWGGNVIWTQTGATLIDPAAHGGHGETDLAMLALFGLPHLERVRDAYAEEAALDAGWRDRVALHQLHPLLVHVVLFGAGYRAQLLAAVGSYG